MFKIKSLHEFRTGQVLMVFTVLAILYVPFGAVTSFYGMNVIELSDGTYTHIRTFWEVAASVTVGSVAIPLFGTLVLAWLIRMIHRGLLNFVLSWPVVVERAWKLYIVCILVTHLLAAIIKDHKNKSIGRFIQEFFTKLSWVEPVIVNGILAILEFAMAIQSRLRLPGNGVFLGWLACAAVAGTCSGAAYVDKTQATLILPTAMLFVFVLLRSTSDFWRKIFRRVSGTSEAVTV